MKTFQDYLSAPDKLDFIRQAINDHLNSEVYKIAVTADEYERQQNTTIRSYVKYLYTQTGQKVVDFTATNNKLCNNFFHRLNTDRCAYSLGNGITFPEDNPSPRNVKNNLIITDIAAKQGSGIKVTIKERLGKQFDTILYNCGYYALIHGVCYAFWNMDTLHLFPVTQFCPLYDEDTGRLRAGIRFWSLDWGNKPVEAVLYLEEGYIRYRTKPGSKGLDLVEYQPLRAYKQEIAYTAADGDEIVGESNYGSLPIIPLYGSRRKQSTLIGMRDKLDAYDLIQSGFANDLQDCAEIYWIISNAMGMTDPDMNRFRDRIKLNHIAVADTENSPVTPYTQEIPFQARKAFLDDIRNSLYEDFGDLDVHTVAAGDTNDHIDAAYQPMDEEADDFEYQIITFVRQLLSLLGVDAVPQFKRNRISNQKEQTEMVLSAYGEGVIDRQTSVEKLSWITVDEVDAILDRMDAQDVADKRDMEKLRKAMEDDQAREDGEED